MNKNDYDYLIKIMLIGDSNVGKSSILRQFSDELFSIEGVPTIGIDFKLKRLDVDNKLIKIQLLDTAGQERFKSITSAHYRNAHVIIMVYDITNRDSFNNIDGWLQNIDKILKDRPTIYIVGNKKDKENRVVSFEDGENLANNYKFKFFETSATENSNISEMFNIISSEYINKKLSEIKEKENENENGNIVIVKNIVSQPNKSNKKCCKN